MARTQAWFTEELYSTQEEPEEATTALEVPKSPRTHLACMRRWNTLLHILQIREYHSPMRLKEALKRVPMYKHSMQRLKVNWIGLNSVLHSY